MEFFCSTIIPTIGRKSLHKSVESVLNQEFSRDKFEIIVVNDSGAPLEEAIWQKENHVQIINTIIHERSVARNTGASIAKGRYLHFLDDDDWLDEDALKHLWSLSQTSQAKWLYGVTQLVDRNHVPIIRLHHKLNGNCLIQVMAGEWIPLQSSLIDTLTFFEVGGFNTLLSGPEDIDLLRRVSIIGDIAETPNLISFVVRGEQGSTTNYHKHPEERRWAREKVLDTPNVFSRLRASAKTSSWRGRIARIFLTSMIWNIRHHRLFTALSRLIFGLIGILSAGLDIFTLDYWNSFFCQYNSKTFQRGIETNELKNNGAD